MSAEGSGGGWEGGSAEQTRLPDWKTKSTGHFHTEVQDRSLSTAVQEAYPVSTQLKRQVIPPPPPKKKKKFLLQFFHQEVKKYVCTLMVIQKHCRDTKRLVMTQKTSVHTDWLKPTTT